MPRNLDPAFQAALAAGVVYPAILVAITFKTGTEYIWTGIGPLVYNAQTFQGVGSLGGVGTITEGIEVKAEGTTLSLSGIDPALYASCMEDIQLGAPAKIWLACLTEGVIIGAPYLMFAGQVDKTSVTTGVDEISISLNLESRMIDLQRALQTRYTSTDQRVLFSDDTGFENVEQLADQSITWGS